MKKALAVLSVLGLAASAANAQLSIVNNLPGAFIDISGTGTNLNVEGDDTGTLFAATHGNSIHPAGNLFVQTNGTATNSAFTSFSNSALPFAGAVYGYAPFWDDFRTDLGGGDIFAQNLADRTIIQWNNVRTFAGPGTDFGTFQLQIFSAGPVLAQFAYQDVIFGNASDNGGSATIGVEALNGSVAQWSLNTPGAVTAGTVLSVIPTPGAAALLGLGGLAAIRRRRV